MAEENMADNNKTQDATAQQGPRASQFAVQRIYLKDMSFESPMGVAAFQMKTQPKVEQDLNTSVNKVGDNAFEVVLKLTINAAVEGKSAFLVEVHQAGLFHIAGLEGPQLAHLCNTACAQILFPYAREAIDSAVVKGGFPALNLPPINFDALFAHAVKEARSQAGKTGEAASDQAESNA